MADLRRPLFFLICFFLIAAVALILVPQPIISAFAPKALFVSMLALMIWCAVYLNDEPACTRWGLILLATAFVIVGLLMAI
jgi:hypothetical protein